MVKYEYLVMVAIASTNWAEICDLPVDKRPPQTWTTTFHVWPPGSKTSYERPDDDWLAIFNELGSQGWKLVESAVTHSRIYDYLNEPNNFYGHKAEVAAPLHTRFIFMREAEA